MKITLLPTSPGIPSAQFLTSFIVNDHVAIDAGALGFCLEPIDQAAIRHIFVSHTHIDHLASLPIFLDNIVGMNDSPVIVHASDVVQQSLRLDLFNDRLWPNFLELTLNNKRFVTLSTIEDGRTVAVEGLRITPVGVNHVVPTLGFIIEDDRSAVIIASDTGPTEEIWRRANVTPNLKAIYLEATFPIANEKLAEITGHLTPAGFVAEMKKVARPVTWLAVHLKARFREQVAKELRDQRLPNLEIAEFGVPREF